MLQKNKRGISSTLLGRSIIVIAGLLCAFTSFSNFEQSIRFNGDELHHSTHLQLSDVNDRITFKVNSMQPGEGPFRNATMGGRYRCTPDVKLRTQTLPLSLQQRGMLDFATSIITNLKTLIVGDSIGQQLSEALDESSGMLNSWARFNTSVDDPTMVCRKLLWGCGGYCETLSISSPLRGGGLSAY